MNAMANTSAFFVHKLDESTDLAILEQQHAEELYTLIDRNRAHLRRWLPWVDKTNSVDDTLAFIAQATRDLATDGTIVAGIRHNGVLDGIVGLHTIGVKSKEIGYWLDEECQGKGLVTKACRALILHAFVALETNRIEIRIQPENERSMMVADRLGFTYEGTLREKGLNADGDFVDLKMYSLLKNEWEVRQDEY